MKNLKMLPLLLLLLSFIACKKDKKTNPGEDVNAVPELRAIASIALTNPCAIAVSQSGKIAITEYKQSYGSVGTTKIWNSYTDLMANKAPAFTLQNIAAEAAAFDKDDNLYVVETEQTAAIKVYKKVTVGGLDRYDPWKTYQGGFNNPRGIAFDSKNRLYLADDGNDRLLRFNTPYDNGIFAVVAATFGNLKGLAIASDTLYITGYTRNLLYKSDITAAGGLNEKYILGGMNKVVDVATNGNFVAVASPENSTITLLKASVFKTEDNYSGKTTQIKSTGAIYGVAFVKTTDGKFGLLAAHHAQNKVILYQP